MLAVVAVKAGGMKGKMGKMGKGTRGGRGGRGGRGAGRGGRGPVYEDRMDRDLLKYFGGADPDEKAHHEQLHAELEATKAAKKAANMNDEVRPTSFCSPTPPIFPLLYHRYLTHISPHVVTAVRQLLQGSRGGAQGGRVDDFKMHHLEKRRRGGEEGRVVSRVSSLPPPGRDFEIKALMITR